MNAKHFVCINNKGWDTELKVRKIYRTLPDKAADRAGWIRVIDESGEDYLYPSDRFIPIELTEEIERALYATEPVV